MQYSNIAVEKKEGIAWVALDRPQAANAMSRATLAELAQAFEAAEADDEVKVIVFTARGKVFTAGADAKELVSAPPGEFFPENENPAQMALERLTKPVIAAINGPCFTGGLEMILSCDMIVAAENATFTDAHARYGLVHGWGGSQRLPRTVGPMRAREIMFTCRPVTAQEAERIGLVNRVVPADKLEEAVTELARLILGNSSISLRVIKSMTRRGLATSLEAGLKIEAQEYVRHMKQGVAKDAQGRIQSFLGKKKD